MKKENLIALSIWAPILIFIVYSCNKQNPEEMPLPIESKYELNILAKKYDIPLEVARKINKSAIRIEDTNGNSNWPESIVKISAETAVPEKVIAAFLVDLEAIARRGDYDDQSRSE